MIQASRLLVGKSGDRAGLQEAAWRVGLAHSLKGRLPKVPAHCCPPLAAGRCAWCVH